MRTIAFVATSPLLEIRRSNNRSWVLFMASLERGLSLRGGRQEQHVGSLPCNVLGISFRLFPADLEDHWSSSLVSSDLLRLE